MPRSLQRAQTASSGVPHPHGRGAQSPANFEQSAASTERPQYRNSTRETAVPTIGKPGMEDLMLANQADTQAWYGKLRSARELTRRALDSAEHNEARETAAGYQAESALREVELGNSQQARTDAN